jgi:diadenosine tetraphosphate (Ap4A) HIT family hydrolase
MGFEIHPQLQKDCIEFGRFELCHLLLMNDSNFPWFILVPERRGISEIYQLDEADQIQLLRESSCLARELAESFKADKMNVAALGNLVPQLHVHHIVRYTIDPAWPGPIWGRVEPVPYTDPELGRMVGRVSAMFTGPDKPVFESKV